jgi:hypothetical protein
MFKTGPVRIYVLNYIKEHYREHSCSVLGTKKKARDVCLVLDERNTREHSCSVLGTKKRPGIVVWIWTKGTIESIVVQFWVQELLNC